MLSGTDQCQVPQRKVRNFNIRDLYLTLPEDIISTNTYVKRFLIQRYFIVASTDIPSSSNCKLTNSEKEENAHF